jgi:hypothetical protein
VTHTDGGVDGAAEDRMRAVLEGLRAATKPDGRAAVLGTSDAQAILDGAWSMLSQAHKAIGDVEGIAWSFAEMRHFKRIRRDMRLFRAQRPSDEG